MKIQNIDLSLEKMQDGKLQNCFEKEMKKVIESFVDENINTKDDRKIQITLKFSIFDNKEILVASDIKTTIPKKQIASSTIAAIKTIQDNYKFTERKDRKQILDGQIDFEDIIRDEIDKENILSMYEDTQKKLKEV